MLSRGRSGRGLTRLGAPERTVGVLADGAWHPQRAHLPPPVVQHHLMPSFAVDSQSDRAPRLDGFAPAHRQQVEASRRWQLHRRRRWRSRRNPVKPAVCHVGRGRGVLPGKGEVYRAVVRVRAGEHLPRGLLHRPPCASAGLSRLPSLPGLARWITAVGAVGGSTFRVQQQVVEVLCASIPAARRCNYVQRQPWVRAGRWGGTAA